MCAFSYDRIDTQLDSRPALYIFNSLFKSWSQSCQILAFIIQIHIQSFSVETRNACTESMLISKWKNFLLISNANVISLLSVFALRSLYFMTPVVPATVPTIHDFVYPVILMSQLKHERHIDITSPLTFSVRTGGILLRIEAACRWFNTTTAGNT